MSNSGASPQAEWFVAKYMSDLSRREPQNIGVILSFGGRFFARFRGESHDSSTADLKIDGRRAKFAESLDNYKAWVHYWRYTLDEVSESFGSIIDDLLKHTNDQNYYIERGGKQLFNSEELEPVSFLSHLYSHLIEDSDVGYSSSSTLKSRSEDLLKKIGIWDKVKSDASLDISSDGETSDRIYFDYQYRNGANHLMKSISLVSRDELTWQRVHAASWNFVQLRDLQEKNQFNPIALVLSGTSQADGNTEDGEAQRQLNLLNRFSSVVIIDDTDTASKLLTDILQGNSNSRM